MAKYLQKVRDVLNKLERYEVHQLPREQNEAADWLATLASSLASVASQKITFLALGRSKVKEGVQTLCIQR